MNWRRRRAKRKRNYVWLAGIFMMLSTVPFLVGSLRKSENTRDVTWSILGWTTWFILGWLAYKFSHARREDGSHILKP